MGILNGDFWGFVRDFEWVLSWVLKWVFYGDFVWGF